MYMDLQISLCTSQSSTNCETDNLKIKEFLSSLQVDTYVSYKKFDRTQGKYQVNKKISSSSLEYNRFIVQEADVTPHVEDDDQYFEVRNVRTMYRPKGNVGQGGLYGFSLGVD